MTIHPHSPISKDLFLLDPTVTFLNHGSFGATPRPVFEKYQWWQRELERQPVEFLGRRYSDLMREARVALAEYIHTEANTLIFVANATTGLNIVARSLLLKPGDEILTTDHEYGALDRTWRFICRKTGAVYSQLPIPLPMTTADDFIERVWSAVTPRTRVLFLSHVTSPTALIFPIQELCRRARERSIISIVDGAHALGQLPLDMKNIGADFYSSNAHKWLCAPKGAAFLYARPEVQELIEPLVVSWGYESERPGTSKFIDEQEWTGTRDPAAWLAVPEAIKFCNEHHWDNVRLRCHTLAHSAREQIGGLTGLPHICPDSTEWYMQMFTAPLPPCDTAKLKSRLYDEFRIEVPIVEWHGKPFIRVSIQVYNTMDDVERLIQALKTIFQGGDTDERNAGSSCNRDWSK